eukprot:9478923-Pyramimonas_sp.AAC.1
MAKARLGRRVAHSRAPQCELIVLAVLVVQMYIGRHACIHRPTSIGTSTLGTQGPSRIRIVLPAMRNTRDPEFGG